MRRAIPVFLWLALLGTGAAFLLGCGPSEPTLPEAAAPADGGPRADGTIRVTPGKQGPCPCELGLPCEEECKGAGKGAGGGAGGGSCGGKSGKSAACSKKDASGCVCAQGQAGAAVWCKKCGVGYVKGAQVACESCVKTALEADKSGP